jgi:hypothetical protein
VARGVRMIEAWTANERRATNGSPDPRAFTSESPNIRCAGNNKSWMEGKLQPGS